MSMKMVLDVGYFDPDVGYLLPLTVNVAAVREAIVRSGGRLPDGCGPDDAQRVSIAAAMKAIAGREVLGFLGSEFVVLHESGFLMTAVGYAPYAPMHAFLSIMCREQGCQVYSSNDAKVVTDAILDQLAVGSQSSL